MAHEFPPTSWSELADTQLGVDKIATSPTAFALYQNLIAAFQGAVGAPRLHRGALHTATGTLTQTGGDPGVSEQVLPGGEHGFCPRFQYERVGGTPDIGNRLFGALGRFNFMDSDGSPGPDETLRWAPTGIQPAASTTLAFEPYVTLVAQTGGAGMTGADFTMKASQRYVQSSPPYDLGDGQLAGFIYANVQPGGGLALWAAPDPPWRSARRRAARLTADDVKAGRCSLELLIAARREATSEPVTVGDKLAGMDRRPHPFINPNGPVVMIDPMEGLAELLVDQEEGALEVANLATHLEIDPDPLKRAGPPGVQVCRVRLRDRRRGRNQSTYWARWPDWLEE